MKSSIRLLTVREAAGRLGFQESTIRKWIQRRQIDYVKSGRRAVRIPIEEVERIIKEGYRPLIEAGKVSYA